MIVDVDVDGDGDGDGDGALPVASTRADHVAFAVHDHVNDHVNVNVGVAIDKARKPAHAAPVFVARSGTAQFTAGPTVWQPSTTSMMPLLSFWTVSHVPPQSRIFFGAFGSS